MDAAISLAERVSQPARKNENCPPRPIRLIGYGHPGRPDDGLGRRLADAVADRAIGDVTVVSDYQLQLEHTADIAEHEVVVFADATVRGPDPFDFFPVEPEPDASFSTHSVSPAALLALAEEHFGTRTQGYALAIRGHEFDDYDERLSDRARANLEAAIEFIIPLLQSGDFASNGLADRVPADSAATAPARPAGGA